MLKKRKEFCCFEGVGRVCEDGVIGEEKVWILGEDIRKFGGELFV